MGIEVYMITGDNGRTARAIALSMATRTCRGGPEQKVSGSEEIAGTRQKVAHRDGINDSPGARKADLWYCHGREQTLRWKPAASCR